MAKSQPPHDDNPDKLLTLDNLKGGVAAEYFERALSEVLENIADENVVAKGKRRIILSVEFSVGEDREVARADVDIKTKLQPLKPATTLVYMGRRMGALVAVEYDPAQRDIFDPELGDNITPINDGRKAAGETE